MADDDLLQFVAKVDAFARDLANEGMKEILTAIGMGAKEDIADAVRQTPARAGRSLADQSMSGWRRKGGEAGLIEGGFNIENGQLTIHPKGRSTGQMRVLEDGRKAHAAGGMRVKGRYVSKKTGQVTNRMAKVNRQIHPYPGKGTWTNAERAIERNMVRHADSVLFERAKKSLY